MKLRKVVAMGLCITVLLQSMGMVSMAKISEQVELESVISSVANSSDAGK